MAIYELLEVYAMLDDEKVIICENGTEKKFSYKEVKKGRRKPMFRKMVAWFYFMNEGLKIEVW